MPIAELRKNITPQIILISCCCCRLDEYRRILEPIGTDGLDCATLCNYRCLVNCIFVFGNYQFLLALTVCASKNTAKFDFSVNTLLDKASFPASIFAFVDIIAPTSHSITSLKKLCSRRLAYPHTMRRHHIQYSTLFVTAHFTFNEGKFLEKNSSSLLTE